MGQAGDARREIGGTKKKDLNLASAEIPPPSIYRSIFTQKKLLQSSQKLPGQSVDLDPDEDRIDLATFADGDIASRYQELKRRTSDPAVLREIKRLSALSIIRRAQNVLGSVVHPMEYKIDFWDELPSHAQNPEIDIETTFEERSLPTEVWMSYQVPRRQPVVLSVDTSLSMTGEKLALTAVALAVVLLQFQGDPIGVVTFESKGKVIRRPEDTLTVVETIERFLDAPTHGYTHLEEGLKETLILLDGLKTRFAKPAAILLTDGKYTAGKDPSYLAPRFDHLMVLKMGPERASLDLCRELSAQGNGKMREVKDLLGLPEAMYSVVKDLLRGPRV